MDEFQSAEELEEYERTQRESKVAIDCLLSQESELMKSGRQSR